MVYFVYKKLKQLHISRDMILKSELKRIKESEKSKTEKMWWEKL